MARRINIPNPYGTQILYSRAENTEEVQKSGVLHAKYEQRAARIKRQKVGIVAAGVIIGTTGLIGTAAEVIADPDHSLKNVPAPLFYAAFASPLVFSALHGNAKSRETTNKIRMDNNLLYAYAHTDPGNIYSGGTNTAASIEPWMLNATNKDEVLAKMRWIPDATYTVTNTSEQTAMPDHVDPSILKALPAAEQKVNE